MRLFCLRLLFRLFSPNFFYTLLTLAHSLVENEKFSLRAWNFFFFPQPKKTKMECWKATEKKESRNHGLLINLTRPRAAREKCRGKPVGGEVKNSRFVCSWQAAPVAAAEVSTANTNATAANKPPLDISLATLFKENVAGLARGSENVVGVGRWKDAAVALCILFCDCI